MKFTSTAGLLRAPATALRSYQRRMDVMAHNLANVSTAGFKRVYAVGSDSSYEQLRPRLRPEVTDQDLPQGSGVASFPTGRVFTQGGIETTGRELDVAVFGDGLLVVQGADGGRAYTRDGAFTVDQTGRIVSASGGYLIPDVTLPAGGRVVGVTADGQILAAAPGGEPAPVGRVYLARFNNPEGLEPVGDNVFVPGEASGEAVVGEPGSEGLGVLVPRALELSNIDIAEEMVNLLAAQRAYQLSARSLQMADQMLALADGLWT